MTHWYDDKDTCIKSKSLVMVKIKEGAIGIAKIFDIALKDTK